MMRAVLLAFATLSAAACAPPAQQPPPPTPDEVVQSMPQNADEAAAADSCGAAAFQSAIGAPVGDLSLPAGARVIGPDTVVTQDFAPARLNVITDAEGRVTELRCY